MTTNKWIQFMFKHGHMTSIDIFDELIFFFYLRLTLIIRLNNIIINIFDKSLAVHFIT